jgi:uncharacterized protein (DUF433 family)
MPSHQLLQRIVVNPAILTGKLTVRGTRVTVSMVIGMMAAGHTPEAFLKLYPYLEADDIRACLTYAHAVLAGDSLEAVRVVPAEASAPKP